MPDVSLGSGEKVSRSSRGRVGSFNVGAPGVSSQVGGSGRGKKDINAAGAPGRALAGVGQAFTAFFPALAQLDATDHREELEKVEEENIQLARKANNTVLQNYAKARQAIKSNDFSQFPNLGTDFLTRKAGIENFKIATGRLAAFDMANGDEFRQRLAAAGEGADPLKVRDEMLREETEGADPLYAEAFGQDFVKATDFQISQQRQINAAAQAEKMFDVAVAEMTKAAVSGELTTVQDLDAFRAKATAAGLMAGRDGAIAADHRFRTEFIKLSESNHSLVDLLHASAPDVNDGMSIAQMEPEAVAASVARNLANFGQERTTAWKESRANLQQSALDIASGESNETPSSYLGRVRAHNEKFGPSNQGRQLEAQAIAMLDDKVSLDSVFATIAGGGTTQMTASDWKQIDLEVYDTFPAWAAARGIEEADAQSMMANQLSHLGASSNLRNTIHGDLFGDDVPQSETTFNLMNAAGAMSPNGGVSNFMSARTEIGFRAMQIAKRQGISPEDARQRFMSAPPNEAPRDTWLASGMGMTQKDQDDLRDKMPEAIEAKLEGMGFDLSASAFQLGGLGNNIEMSDADDWDPAIWRAADETLKTVAWLYNGTKTPEELAEIRNEMIAARIGITLKHGNKHVTLMAAQAVVTGPDGQAMRVQNPSWQSMENMQASIARDGPGLGFDGDVTGIHADELTEFNMGYAVEIAGNEIIFPTDVTQVFTADEADSAAFDGFQKELTPNGNVAITFTSDQDRMQISDTMFFQRMGPGRGWSLRVTEAPAGTAAVEKVRQREEHFARIAAGPVGVGGLPSQTIFPGTSGLVSPAGTSSVALPGAAPQDPAQPAVPLPQPLGTPGLPSQTIIPGTSGLVGPSDRFPISGQQPTMTTSGREPSMGRNYRQQLERGLEDGRKAGTISPPQELSALSKADPQDGQDVADRLQDAARASKSDGIIMLNLGGPKAAPFMMSFTEFLEPLEGNSPRAYDDANTRTINMNTKVIGDPTIGIGFNLTRKDARAKIEALGANYDKVLRGEQDLDPSQVRQLLVQGAQEASTWLFNHFKDEVGILEEHQWVALLSLAYNSRWTDNGPTLIGPDITAAIKRGDFEAAANEIEFKSAAGVRPNQQVGINLRRRKEAMMFRGSFDTAGN